MGMRTPLIFSAWQQILRQTDLKSMNEMIQNHANLLGIRQCKYMKTSDKQTLRIAQSILNNKTFLHRYILGHPSTSISQIQSIPVVISNIRKYPFYYNQYLQWKQHNKGRIIAIGGPSACDQTILSSMIQQIRQNNQIHYYCKDYLQSNILHSASQSHARHGNALNADPVLSGRHLLPLVIKRKLKKSTEQSVLSSDYIKVDIALQKFKYLRVYIQNQINGIIQILKSKLGIMNQHDLNRLQSIASQQIQKVIEDQLKISFRSNKQKAQQQQSMALHVIFTKACQRQVQSQHLQFKKVKQLKWNQMSQGQINRYLPHSNGVLSAFRYHGDYSNKFDMHQTIRNKSVELGAIWKEEKIVTNVFVDKNQSGNPYVCGVLFKDGQFVAANRIHLSLGYKVKYLYEGLLTTPLNNIVVPATGVSMTIIVKKTKEIKEVIREKGLALQIAIVNSHWTIIEQNQDYLLMRATAGGNTGSESYKPSYFLNLTANTRRIFGEAFIGIVSSFGCTRAVNYKNSTQFADIAQGLVISYGKGGTGNTKRSSQAYKALHHLGFSKQIQEYFGKVKQNRLNISSTMKKICKASQKSRFYYSNRHKTKQIISQ